MKPTVTKQKDARGRIRSHVATFGPIECSSSVSAADAIATCARETAAALERLERGTTIGQWQGHTYVVSPDCHGWRTWCDAFSSGTYHVAMSGTKEDAADSILSHLASIVWTHDVTDDRAYVATLPERLRRDLLERFAWYRKMRAFMALGYTDQQSRDLIAQGTVPDGHGGHGTIVRSDVA